ncbi:hypothetical protein D3C76_1229510 [compost metagenome]
MDQITRRQRHITSGVSKVACSQGFGRLNTGNTADGLVVEPACNGVEITGTPFECFLCLVVDRGRTKRLAFFVFMVVVGINRLHWHSW